VEFRYTGPITGPVDIPALGITVEPGEAFEATGEDAKGLLAQPSNFERTDKPVSRTTDTEES
jgi:hypothetical protein